MSLPALIDYTAPVPPVRELPPSRAPWALDPSRAAVLVHDLQHYFLRPYAPGCPALVTALESTARILTAARTAGVPIYYTAQDGDHSDRGLQGDLWGPGMSRDPAHTNIVSEVTPGKDDEVVTKRRYSAFAKSDFTQRLSAAERDQLVITGVYAHIGITATAYDAFQREVHPFVVADAVADFGLDQHARALDQVAGCCAAVVLADEVVAAFEALQQNDLHQDRLHESQLSPGASGGDWAGEVRSTLHRVLPADVVARAFAHPGDDLFELGLNSLQAFEVLDVLAEAGVDIDFGAFTRRANINFLLEQGAAQASC